MTRTPLDVEAIANKLTLEEKIQLLAGSDFWRTVPIPSKDVPYIKVTDGPNGARGGGDIHDSAISAALFPAPACLGATWDVELAELMGKGIAQDSRSKQAHVSLAPTINIQRDPRGGRSFESYSEDPILSGDLGAAWITGCQGQGVLATPKHFVANECEDKRRTVSSEIEEAPLREIYLRPFQRVIRNLRQKNLDGPGCIMTSYNKLNGVSCSHNERLLKDILREEWGYEGLVMSDWFGTYSTAEALQAGLDLEMPGPTLFRSIEKVHRALESGQVTEADIDARARKVIELIAKIGKTLANNSPPLDFLKSVSEEREVSLQNEEISKSIRTIGAEGMVLLRNENNLLPLEPTKKGGPKKIAFIGAPAVTAIQSGGGSANLTAQYKTPPLSGFQDVLKELGADAEDVQVIWSEGCQLHTSPPLPTAEHLGDKKVTLEWYNGTTTPSNEEPYKVTESDSPSHSLFTPMPKGIQKTFSMRVKYTLTPKTTGVHTFGIQGYGYSTLTVGSETWQYESIKDPFEYLVSMDKHRDMRTVTLEAGKPTQVELLYSPHILQESLATGPFASFRIGFEEYYDEEKALADAVQTAKDADIAIVFTATGKEYETEGFDREHIKLPRRQNDLVEAVLAVQPNKTVVVNLTGSAVEMPWIDRVPAVVQAWFPGQECGRAIADVLLGRGAAGGPSGRMPSAWPKKIEDHPSFGNFPGKEEGEQGFVVHYAEGRFVGHKWYEEKEIDPLFWFGYGLSYTTWKRELVSLEGALTSDGGKVTVNVRVQNTGDRVGKDVVQLYVKPPSSAVGRPKRALVAFTKVTLNPGESRTVALDLDQEAVSYWDQGEKGHWKVDQGTYEVVLATSSNPKDEVASTKLEVEQEWTWRGAGNTK